MIFVLWLLIDRSMERLKSASLGAMGSLLRKLDEQLVPTERRVGGLGNDLGIISAMLQKLSELEKPSLSVNYWMKDVREISYDMEDCVDQFIHAEGTDTKTVWIHNLLRQLQPHPFPTPHLIFKGEYTEKRLQPASHPHQHG
jgi:hypothetical protein